MQNLPPYEPIDCGDYDHIELACVQRYLLDVVSHEGTTQGRALTMVTEADGEYLILELDDTQQHRIRVDQIRQITVLSHPRHFERLVFKTD